MSTDAQRAPQMTGHELYLIREGTHTRQYESLGAHVIGDATHFAVWAPNAQSVSVIGDFNGWDPRTHPLKLTAGDSGDAGIWQGSVPGV